MTETTTEPTFLITPAKRGGAFRLHRLTCKRALAHPEVHETTRTRETSEFVAATCCKPILAPPAPPKVRSLAEARANQHAAKAADNKASVGKLNDVEDEFVDKMHKAIAKVTSPDRPKRAERSPEYAKAVEAKKAGKRGKGKTLTDDELDAYIRKAHEARPAAFSAEQLEIAYWVDGIALSRARWVAAWARVFGGASS